MKLLFVITLLLWNSCAQTHWHKSHPAVGSAFPVRVLAYSPISQDNVFILSSHRFARDFAMERSKVAAQTATVIQEIPLFMLKGPYTTGILQSGQDSLFAFREQQSLGSNLFMDVTYPKQGQRLLMEPNPEGATMPTHALLFHQIFYGANISPKSLFSLNQSQQNTLGTNAEQKELGIVVGYTLWDNAKQRALYTGAVGKTIPMPATINSTHVQSLFKAALLDIIAVCKLEK
jgi:hypothetical protein